MVPKTPDLATLRIGLSAVLFASLTGCCTLPDESRSGLRAYSQVIALEGQWIVETGAIDPIEYGMRDGEWDRERCLEAARMLDLFRQGNPVIATTLQQLADEEPIAFPNRERVDYEEQCPDPARTDEPTSRRTENDRGATSGSSEDFHYTEGPATNGGSPN